MDDGRIGFLSRAQRTSPIDMAAAMANSAPPVYIEGEFSKQRMPNFAPFSTTSKRESIVPKKDNAPPPGTYNLQQDFTKSKSAAGLVYRSKTKRFEGEKKEDFTPGPGTYNITSYTTLEKPRYTKSPERERFELPHHPSAPSIPTKFQSYGYDETPDGHLVCQQPLRPGYTGIKGDTVGPGDYDPTMKAVSRNTAVPTFKGSERVLQSTKSNANIGPGYYNVLGTFDLLNAEKTYENESNFVMQLNAARSKKATSSFSSATGRSSIIPNRIDPDEPGPGTYNVPRNGVEIKTKDVKIQCFATTEQRFRDPQPRSQRIKTSPGTYNILSSDFDLNRLKILRHKRMAARSGWAQNIAFESTEERFHELDHKVVPPPGTYRPKVTIADEVKRPNPRSGPFGTTSKRFTKIPGQLVENSSSPELQEVGHGSTYSGPRHKQRRPKPLKSSVFASDADRFRKVEEDPGPPPGHYNVAPSWKAKGVVPLGVPKNEPLQRDPDTRPGPGDYDVKIPSFKPRRNRKNIMGSSVQRFVESSPEPKPGPGYYNPSSGTLVRPSFNVMLDRSF